MNEIVETHNPDKDREEKIRKLKELYKKITPDSPDPKAVDELRRFIQENADLFWEKYSLSNDVILSLLKHPETDNKFKLTVLETLKEIKRQLNYENSTIIEKMVIDSILVSWVRYEFLELIYSSSFDKASITTQDRKHFDQLVTTAQMRMLRAQEALARLRKTGVNLKIRIANKVETQNVQQNINFP